MSGSQPSSSTSSISCHHFEPSWKGGTNPWSLLFLNPSFSTADPLSAIPRYNLPFLCYTCTSFPGGQCGRRKDSPDPCQSRAPRSGVSFFHCPRFRNNAGLVDLSFGSSSGPARGMALRIPVCCRSGCGKDSYQRPEGAGSRDPAGRTPAVVDAISGAFALAHSRAHGGSACGLAFCFRRRSRRVGRARAE